MKENARQLQYVLTFDMDNSSRRRNQSVNIGVLMEKLQANENFSGITVRDILDEVGVDTEKLDKLYIRRFWTEKGCHIVSQVERFYTRLPAGDIDAEDDDNEEIERPKITLEDLFIPPIWDKIAMQAHEAIALRDIYLVCVDTKRNAPELYAQKAQTVFKIFYYADKAAKVFENNIRSYYSELLPDGYWEYTAWQAKLDLRSIPVFPLLEQYRSFMQTKAAKHLESDYGMRMTKRRYQFHFWQNETPEAKSAVATALENFQSWLAQNSPEGQPDSVQLLRDPTALAQAYVTPIDGFINRHIQEATMQVDGSGEDVVISIRASNSYIWLLPQVTQAGICRICAICGMPFRLGAQRGKKYCERHTAEDFKYFKRALNRRTKTIQKKAEQDKIALQGTK